MWKTWESRWGAKKKASTGGVKKFLPLSTAVGAKESFPHYATSFPHLTVDNLGRKRTGLFLHKRGAAWGHFELRIRS